MDRSEKQDLMVTPISQKWNSECGLQDKIRQNAVPSPFLQYPSSISAVFFRFVFRCEAKDLNFYCMRGGTVCYKRKNDHGHLNVSALSLKIAV
jgi:hypothetical protein